MLEADKAVETLTALVKRYTAKRDSKMQVGAVVLWWLSEIPTT